MNKNYEKWNKTCIGHDNEIGQRRCFKIQEEWENLGIAYMLVYN